MRGEREYEFVAVGVFVAEGDARFLTRTLTAYGYRRDQLGVDLRRRLLAWGHLAQVQPSQMVDASAARADRSPSRRAG
jgi:hypothetical protein